MQGDDINIKLKENSSICNPTLSKGKVHRSITGQDAPNDVIRELFTLPCRLGGLNIPDPVSVSTIQLSNSLLVSSPLFLYFLIKVTLFHLSSVQLLLFCILMIPSQAC